MMKKLPTLLLVFTVGSACAAEQPSWWADNTQHLLERVREAPRLTLDHADLLVKPTSEAVDLGMVSSAAAGANGVTYVLHRNVQRDPVIALDADGTMLHQWGKGLYAIPHSIRVDADGNVWTADSGNSQIYKFSPSGEQLIHIDVGEMPDLPHPFKGAADIAFSANGDVYVADGYGNSRVLVYGSNGKRKFQWGEPGRGDGQFNLVHGITIDAGDLVYVADRENGRIQKFDLNGKHLATWDGLGRIFSLQADNGVLWAVTSRLDEPNYAAGWLKQIDPDNGELLGVISATGTHSVTVRSGCEVTMGEGSFRIVTFKPVPGVSCATLTR